MRIATRIGFAGRGGAPEQAFECSLSPPLRYGNLHFTQMLKPTRESFSAMRGFVDWFSSVRISRRRWAPRRALDVKYVAHTWQLYSFELEMGW